MGTPIRIEGWFPMTHSYPDLDRTTLDEKIYKLTAKTYDLEVLHVLPIERFQGSFWNPIEVQAVVDTSIKGSAAPFFVEKSKAKKLKKLIKNLQPSIINL